MRSNNRLLFGLLSLLLAAVIAFVALPTIARQTNGKTEIIRVPKPVLKGAIITDKNVELAEVGSYSLPASIVRSTENMMGKYAISDLMEGDYILSSKISALPLTPDIMLNDTPSGRVAISLSIKTLVSGLSDKLQADDIVRIYRFLETTREIPELRFVKVLSVTGTDGTDIGNAAEPAEDEEKQQSATITVTATPEQARIITKLENDDITHVALISHNNEGLAAELLAEQDQMFSNLESPALPEEISDSGHVFSTSSNEAPEASTAGEEPGQNP